MYSTELIVTQYGHIIPSKILLPSINNHATVDVADLEKRMKSYSDIELLLMSENGSRTISRIAKNILLNAR